MNKNIAKSLVIGFLGLSLILATPNVSAQSPRATSTKPNQDLTTEQKITKIKAKSRQEIDRRLSSLARLKNIIQNMKRIKEEQKASLIAIIDSQKSSLTSLRAKIDADTDLETIKIDAQTIRDTHRIYALILPQVQILAAADRIMNLTDLLSKLTSKLEERINKSKILGQDVAPLGSAPVEMRTKITNAINEARAATDGVVALIPDNGNKAKAQSNRQALVNARARLKAGRLSLRAAEELSRIIRHGLQSLKTATTTPITATTTP